MSKKVVIVGCGDIGQRLARLLAIEPAKYQCLGVSRRGSAPNNPHCQAVKADARDVEAMEPVLRGAYALVITLTPDHRSDEGYTQAYLETTHALLKALGAVRKGPGALPQRIFFVSSTSVYHQQQGEFVDELSPTKPEAFNGRRLLQAEQLWQDSGHGVSVVRFSGIYGPGRTRLLEQVRAGQGSPGENYFTNRIHVDDCAGVLAHLLNYPNKPAPLYLASDCQPEAMWPIKLWLAEQLGLGDHWDFGDKESTRLGRRCSNRRLLSTGYQFSYPSYREGYGALISGPVKLLK